MGLAVDVEPFRLDLADLTPKRERVLDERGPSFERAGGLA